MQQHHQASLSPRYLSPMNAKSRSSTIRRSWDSLVTSDVADSPAKQALKCDRFARRHSETLPRGYMMSGRRSRQINLLVLGDCGVGKSALTVRFLTNRYIGDYMSGQDHVYHLDSNDRRCPSNTAINILDTSCSHKVEAHDVVDNNLTWADGMVVVYDVGSEDSFDFAKELIINIKRESKINSKTGSILRFSKRKKTKPVILIGNKSDILGRKTVSIEEARKFASQHSELVVDVQELSAAEGIEDIRSCLHTFIGSIIKASKSKWHSSNEGISPPSTPPSPPSGVKSKSISSSCGARKKFFDSVAFFHHITRKDRKLPPALISETMA